MDHSLQTLKAAVSLTDEQAQPVGDEARRVLKFFLASLLNANMPRPCGLDAMRSLTTLVPHYAEDVIYPLDAAEVEARTGRPMAAGKLTELTGIMEGMRVRRRCCSFVDVAASACCASRAPRCECSACCGAFRQTYF